MNNEQSTDLMNPSVIEAEAGILYMKGYV